MIMWIIPRRVRAKMRIRNVETGHGRWTLSSPVLATLSASETCGDFPMCATETGPVGHVFAYQINSGSYNF